MSVSALVARGLYNAALWAAVPVAGPWLALKGMRTGKYLPIVRERLGWDAPDLGLEPGCAWLHAVSVGEVLVARGLLRELERRGHGPLALSATTASGLALAREARDRGEVAAVLASPLDYRSAVRSAFARVRPRALVLVEAELWPNWIAGARRREVPVGLVNARISALSHHRYQRVAALFRPVFASLAAVGARTDRDAERLVDLGVPAGNVAVTGDIKFDVEPPALDCAAMRARLRLPAAGLVVVAGSTHPSEQPVVLEAFRKLRARFPDAVLVLAPRREPPPPPPDLELVLRTAEAPVPAGGVLVLDTIGELRDAYGAADMAFVGGSLGPSGGGHNLLEPAAAGVPVLFGCHTETFAAPAERLVATGGGLRVADAAALERELERLAADRSLRAALGARARAVVAEGRGSTARSAELLEPILAR